MSVYLVIDVITVAIRIIYNSTNYFKQPLGLYISNFTCKYNLLCNSPPCVSSCGSENVDPQSGRSYSQTLFQRNWDLRINWCILSSLPPHSTPYYSLGWNWMRDAGVFALAEAVRVNRSIEKLE